MNITDIKERTRKVLESVGSLGVEVGTMADDADLYEAGLTSRASVNLMLALEDEFDIEFPDHMLNRHMFQSVMAISDAIATVIEES